MGVILNAENISKQYRLGRVGTGTLSHDLNRWWHTVRGKEDPYLKVGGVNDRSAKATEDYVWALRDINFEVKQGEVLGIIGKNGAGKSTLLKILSRVTAPTTGRIRTKGRIASLLEVGTGFHPELTGRENIFMNGAVLGMTKTEIKSKLDEIIAFSGCEKYIDTPTKRYSSGMKVRLGFAVAAHLEPEILVVDEVLAVGDAEFQKKAIGKMQDLSGGEGRTVLFVSHNMASIRSLCSKGIVLENGYVNYNGTADDAIEKYLVKENLDLEYDFLGNNSIVDSFRLRSGINERIIATGEKLEFTLKLNSNFQRNKFRVHIGVYSNSDEKLCNFSSEYFNKGYLKRKTSDEYFCIIPKNPLVPGRYYVNLAFFSETDRLEHHSKCLVFEVLNGDFFKHNRLTDKIPSKFLVDHFWK